MNGGKKGDTIELELGDDDAGGRAGDDTLLGNEDNDELADGHGSDTINGGAGTDTFWKCDTNNVSVVNMEIVNGPNDVFCNF